MIKAWAIIMYVVGYISTVLGFMIYALGLWFGLGD